ncbi:MAG: GntR family transcriptional regulator [Oscillospiraceae bacterium]|jgi:DNA-binding GntR family transcriptional regulator|nr:GntR family transcriptional regulator [Oscillospiraceae bacterium]MCI2035122.1 GntR family transcriptional regulator [Oscillospiraceae bacterium]
MGHDGLLYDVTYQHIRRDIMDLTLEPGTALSVRKIADRYKVGRTPAREALMRLQKENLVYMYPQSGTIVSKLSMGRIEEELFIRKTLELASVDDFIRCKGPLVTDAMEYIVGQQKKSLVAGARKEYFIQDSNFHRLIFEMANKGLAWKTINMISSHYNRFRFLTTGDRETDERRLEQHKQILYAAKAGRPEEMRRILDEHIDHIRLLYKKMLTLYPKYFTGEPCPETCPEAAGPVD